MAAFLGDSGSWHQLLIQILSDITQSVPKGQAGLVTPGDPGINETEFLLLESQGDVCKQILRAG